MRNIFRKNKNEENNTIEDESNDIEEYKISYFKANKRTSVKFENDLKNKE